MMHMIPRLALRRAAVSSTVFPTAIAGGLPRLTRSIYSLPTKVPVRLSKREVDVQVLDLLLDYANTDTDKVTMNSNFIRELLMDRLDRYGFYTDLIEKFDIDIGDGRRFARDLVSAREAADWAAAYMEQEGRLVF
ncbi:hypothetical protein BASA50_002434 [Batrachochytrium salamandrivorans]|uniref:Uncharacterized protein n=1 Tax=Batrachochytrium salamandrivorans TaxID=1357716 RepID=A0ABQ8FLC6_9FUNG|nr:hypothetical protein BASA61_007762 [Batrachochytrium salamandrivorans]KAH6600259.1 hypothetical protein BASA50_002434 [Batrachochytrium salamandrivorans]